MAAGTNDIMVASATAVTTIFGQAPNNYLAIGDDNLNPSDLTQVNGYVTSGNLYMAVADPTNDGQIHFATRTDLSNLGWYAVVCNIRCAGYFNPYFEAVTCVNALGQAFQYYHLVPSTGSAMSDPTALYLPAAAPNNALLCPTSTWSMSAMAHPLARTSCILAVMVELVRRMTTKAVGDQPHKTLL